MLNIAKLNDVYKYLEQQNRLEMRDIIIWKNRIKLVNKIEKIASQESELACYWFGFSFATQDKKILNICNKSIYRCIFKFIK